MLVAELKVVQHISTSKMNRRSTMSLAVQFLAVPGFRLLADLLDKGEVETGILFPTQQQNTFLLRHDCGVTLCTTGL